MTASAVMLKIYFDFLLLNRKANWWSFIGNIEVTCRSKIAKCSQFWLEIQDGPHDHHLETLYWTSLELKCHLTRLVIRWAIQGHLGPLVYVSLWSFIDGVVRTKARTEHTFVIWSCIRTNGKVLMWADWFKPPPFPPSCFSTGSSKVVHAFQFFFVLA